MIFLRFTLTDNDGESIKWTVHTDGRSPSNEIHVILDLYLEQYRSFVGNTYIYRGEEYYCDDLGYVKDDKNYIPALIFKAGDKEVFYDITDKESFSKKSPFISNYELKSFEEKSVYYARLEAEEKARIERARADSIALVEKNAAIKQQQAIVKQKSQKQRQERYERLIRQYGQENADLIISGRVKIGWTIEMCRESWGKPYDINRTTYAWGTQEQWVYSGGNYLYFDNGILTAIQN